MSEPRFDDGFDLLPAPTALPPREQATLDNLIPPFLAWFLAIRGRTEQTVACYGQDLRSFARFCARYKVTTPGQVDHRAIEAYMAWMTRSLGRKASTANRHRYAIGAFFLFLRREGVIMHNPVPDTFALKQPKRLPDFLTIPEQERVLAHLARRTSLPGRRDYALVATALLTGLRVSELATLRVVDIDLETRTLRVIGKGDKERQGVIIPRLAEILATYLRDVRPKLAGAEGVWLFPRGDRRGRMARDGRASLLTRTLFATIRRHVSPIVGRPVHPHMLRHSFATRLYEQGADILLIQEAMGHSQLNTTAIYTHLTTRKKREAIEQYLR